MARSLLLSLLRCVAVGVPAMAMMHKQVHQRAGQQDQVRQDAQQVGAVAQADGLAVDDVALRAGEALPWRLV